MLKANTGQFGLNAERDPPMVVALMPSTQRHRTVAIGVVVVMLAVSALVAPFVNRQIGKIDSFLPVVQTVTSAADLLTATLLLAQYSVQPHRALLVVAGGYIFAGSFAFLQTLSFPGSYAPNGLIGDVYNTPAWFFVLWYTTFPLSILVYALLKDRGGGSRFSTTASMATTLISVFAAIALLSWVAIAETRRLPSFFTTGLMLQTSLSNQFNIGLSLLGCFVLLVLFVRRRTVLDLWLMVTLFAALPNFLVAAYEGSARFSVGWYTARGFALIASCMLLSVLVTEMIVLYSRLASALVMQRRERSNRFVSIDAATAAIAHEIGSPLGAITLNANTARQLLVAQPRRLDEVNAILRNIEEDSLRVNATITSVRGLFKGAVDRPATISLEGVARQVLRLLEHELQFNGMLVATDFRVEMSLVRADPIQLQQVILNLFKNAIEAMASTSLNGRRLNIATRLDERSSFVLLSVQDTGRGVPPQHHDRIFDAFFTTKPSGMGLGLAICRTIIERYGGRLVLAKSSPQGSTFEIALPLEDDRRGSA
ncbi:MASE4 domain-containing protein [Bradyrhizobium guangzhouense]|uniref:histidine kinase n=1 Tax=Bradyrhizobium guangzhouense TaxID=1325095 RepID=A0AAE5WXR6_9BRAD|nr:ATP-binding protein [Bradyrhizobium guangzhouense]QAU44943.1 two-component sensor histidine kinase [Bradyrhizobium guangzhouense]